jgi:hypothetical protein
VSSYKPSTISHSVFAELNLVVDVVYILTIYIIMKLEEKGLIVPPPILNKFPQQVSASIQQWKDIISATHWHLYNSQTPDGADFYVGEEELGHIHLDGAVHLATDKQLKVALLKSKLANNFPYGKDWVCYDILSAKHAEHALFLFKLNYDRIKGVNFKELLIRIKNAEENE